MVDGWYRITWPPPRKEEAVEYVYHNVARSGTVPNLLQRGCILEEVIILTKEEAKVHEQDSQQ